MSEEAATQQTSETISLETPSEAPSFAVPETYQGKDWANNIKSSDDMWKQMDGMQGLIGKKTVPGQDATDEEWDAFHSKLRPETAESYEFNYGDIDPSNINQEEALTYKEGMHKLGLTQKQAQGLLELQMQVEGAKTQTSEEKGADFTSKAKELFGDKAAEAIKIGNTYLRDLPEEQQVAIQELPNDQLLSVSKLLNQLHNKYTREDSPNSGDTDPIRSSNDVLGDLTSAKQKLSKMDFTSPEYADTERRVNELRDQLKKKVN